MKNYLFALIMFVLPVLVKAQDTTRVRYTYGEIVGIRVSNGNAPYYNVYLTDGKKKDPVQRKDIILSVENLSEQMTLMLNKVAEDGWEFISGYSDNLDQKTIVHWIVRRRG